jgi:hypothetical protein
MGSLLALTLSIGACGMHQASIVAPRSPIGLARLRSGRTRPLNADEAPGLRFGRRGPRIVQVVIVVEVVIVVVSVLFLLLLVQEGMIIIQAAGPGPGQGLLAQLQTALLLGHHLDLLLLLQLKEILYLSAAAVGPHPMSCLLLLRWPPLPNLRMLLLLLVLA